MSEVLVYERGLIILNVLWTVIILKQKNADIDKYAL